MIRTKPPSDEYRDGWDRVFGEPHWIVACHGCGKREAATGSTLCEECASRWGAGWPTAHEDDCPVMTGDGSCRCPMGNL